MRLEQIYSIAKSANNVNDFKAVIDNLITGQPVTAKSSNTFELVNVTLSSVSKDQLFTEKQVDDAYDKGFKDGLKHRAC